jgi:predicted nucleotidyltransferase
VKKRIQAFLLCISTNVLYFSERFLPLLTLEVKIQISMWEWDIIEDNLAKREENIIMQHNTLLQELVESLHSVQSIEAIVLGGSYASGVQQSDSDIDIGLYYRSHLPLDITQIRAVAHKINDTSDPVVTDRGSWGPWVNGGAWLTVKGQRVDFLYRNIEFVTRTIEESNKGIIQSHYWQQPAYGFHSYIYCTEIAFCQPLYDPDNVIAQLKTKVEHYPYHLKQAICKDFLWRARFTLDNAYKPSTRGNIYFVAGALARTIHCLVQILYALNEMYYISEKRLTHDIASFTVLPTNFLTRMNEILGSVGTDAAQLQHSLTKTEQLYSECSMLSATIAANKPGA